MAKKQIFYYYSKNILILLSTDATIYIIKVFIVIKMMLKPTYIKIILLLVLYFFTIVDIAQSAPLSKNTLRVPTMQEKTYERIEQSIGNLKKPLVLKGHFNIPDTDILYNVHEITDYAEIIKTFDKWFSSKENRSFERHRWESFLKHKPDYSLTKLESKEGEILGMASSYKNSSFSFSEDNENKEPVYFVNCLEVSEKHRGKGLAQVIIAKIIEKAISDSEIENKVILAVYADDNADSFFEKIGSKYIRIFSKNISFSSRVLYREEALSLLDKIRSNITTVAQSKLTNLNRKIYCRWEL